MSEDVKMIIEKLNVLDRKITDVQETLEGKIADVQETLESKITDIRLTLENETNRNINLIAEGHLDLSRKLDDALKVENEKEILLIRVNHLENEMRRVKEQIAALA